MKKIYLISRVAEDARPLNNKVAAALEAAGYEVFIPHAQPFNNSSGASDAEIYAQDINAMKSADLFVAVGRLGIDCSFELGWAQGRDVPIYRYLPDSIKVERSPMHHFVNSTATYKELEKLVDDVKRHQSPTTLVRVKV
jgi:nucleoside 2-deoxyribosyltransferase